MGPDTESEATNRISVGGIDVELENVACNYCGSVDETEFLTGPDRQIGLPGLFRLVQCTGCGLIRQNPRPTRETIGQYYPTDYQPYLTQHPKEHSGWRSLDRNYGQHKRRRLIESYVPAGKLLDVGSGTGGFLSVISQSGRWTVTGIEPNSHANDIARRAYGLDVRDTTLGGADLPEAYFDVVTLWNVLEHLHSPVDDLREVNRLLRPGGFVVLSVPNLESIEAKIFGNAWIGWELPRHLYLFSASLLARVLGDAGFELLRSECLGGAQLSFVLSVRQVPLPGQRPPWWHGPLIASLSGLPGRLLLSITFWVVSRAKQATIVTYVARKR